MVHQGLEVGGENEIRPLHLLQKGNDVVEFDTAPMGLWILSSAVFQIGLLDDCLLCSVSVWDVLWCVSWIYIVYGGLRKRGSARSLPLLAHFPFCVFSTTASR